MHGLDLLLGSQFARRKQPNLICFCHPSAEATHDALVGAVLLLEYLPWGLHSGVFATTDEFGVRTVVGPTGSHASLCFLAGRFLLEQGAQLTLCTWRRRHGSGAVEAHLGSGSDIMYAVHTRKVQDTLELGRSVEETLQRLGKRTRVHLRADRRRFNSLYPEAKLLDATASLASAPDDILEALNGSALDTIDQGEFNHQVRTVCRGRDGFALGLQLHGRWISLIGGWRQGEDTSIEWQCNQQGFQKVSLGGVLRTYLFEEEARRGGRRLHFHGGTSHSMQHRFQHTPVSDLLMRRVGLLPRFLVYAASLLCRWRPRLLERGNFMLNALCAPGLRWERRPGPHAVGAEVSPSPSALEKR